MKNKSLSKIIQVSTFCFIVLQFQTLSAQNWDQIDAFPGTPRDDASHFKIGNKHYVGTGRELGFGCTSDFYAFDENTLQWENAASLPQGNERQYACAEVWNGKAYLLGGVNCANSYLNDFWCFDAQANTWSNLPNFPSTGRAGMVSFVLFETLFVVGGRNDTGILNEVWAYDFTSQTWTQKNNLPFSGIWRGIAFSFQNEVHIGFGKNNLNNQSDFNASFWRYLAASDVWELDSSINWGQKAYVGCTQTDSLLFLFGGLSPNGEILNTVQRVHLADFTVDSLANFPAVARKGGVTFLMGNDLYYSTGVSTDTRFNETWRLHQVATVVEHEMTNLSVFPNPTNEWLYLQSDEVIEHVQLFDLQGRNWMGFTVNDSAFKWNISDLQSGHYFLQIKLNGKQIIRNLVIYQ